MSGLYEAGRLRVSVLSSIACGVIEVLVVQRGQSKVRRGELIERLNMSQEGADVEMKAGYSIFGI